jgi:hypothetical protein
MGDSTLDSAKPGSLTGSQREWSVRFCGIDITSSALEAEAAPGGSESRMSLGMRARPSQLDKSRDQAVRDVIGDSSDIPRRQVEDALKEFLSQLAKAQKTATVKVSDKVLSVERVLHDGLGADSPPLLKSGDSRDYEPADLARKIADALPDALPAANMAVFRRLRPVEFADAGGMTDQIRRKYEEERDKLLLRLPESIRGVAKKAIESAVEKGVPFAAGQIFSGLGAGSGIQNDVKKFVADWAKKVTDG